MVKSQHNRDLLFKNGFISESSMQNMREELAYVKDGWVAPGRTLREDVWKRTGKWAELSEEEMWPAVREAAEMRGSPEHGLHLCEAGSEGVEGIGRPVGLVEELGAFEGP